MAADADVEVDDQRELPGRASSTGPWSVRDRRRVDDRRRRARTAPSASRSWLAPRRGVPRAATPRTPGGDGVAATCGELASARLVGSAGTDAHAHVVPAGLAGDRIGVADRAAAAVAAARR